MLEHVCDFGAWVCWVGHSTVLIHLNGKWILTDPALSLEKLPKHDLVLLSHAHMDHMDRQTLDALREIGGTLGLPVA